MFALEIDFHDGMSPPETILVRRSSAIIGSSECAHVVVEGTGSDFCELRLTRELGRKFRCHPVKRGGREGSDVNPKEEVFSGQSEIRLGDISAYITALDLDLRLMPEESPDCAGIRILRTALSEKIPVFPAIAVLGGPSTFLSFTKSQPLIIGRSRKCGLRLNASDVSGEHARIGYDEGRYWVEDLGSTNGTFVAGERVSGRKYLEEGETVSIGSGVELAVVLDNEEAARLSSQAIEEASSIEEDSRYPCIVSGSDDVRPGQFEFGNRNVVTVGRDPANDIWIGAVHISRRHLEIRRSEEGEISVVDLSSNGTYLDGERLPREIPVPVGGKLGVLDLCAGVTMAVCLSRQEEEAFWERGDSGEMVNEEMPSIDDRSINNGEERPSGNFVERAFSGSLEETMTGAGVKGSAFQEVARQFGETEDSAFGQQKGRPLLAVPEARLKEAVTTHPSRKGVRRASRCHSGRLAVVLMVAILLIVFIITGVSLVVFGGY